MPYFYAKTLLALASISRFQAKMASLQDKKYLLFESVMHCYFCAVHKIKTTSHDVRKNPLFLLVASQVLSKETN